MARKTNPCDYCDGSLRPRKVTVVRNRRGKYVVIEKVPASVCNRCGVRYFDSETVKTMQGLIKRRKRASRKVEIPVTTYEVVA